MLCNLHSDLQYRKIECLHSTIMNNFGIVPEVFRAGRWGYDDTVGEQLNRLRYTADTSVTPFSDWSEYQGPDFSSTVSVEPYMISIPNDSRTETEDCLMEIPVSIGFLQKNFVMMNRVMKILRTRPFQSFHMLGILRRLKLLNFVWLSPELSTTEDMVGLFKAFVEKGHTLVNMMFHSTSLVPAKSPFVPDEHALEIFYSKIEGFLHFATEQGAETAMLSDAARHYRKIRSCSVGPAQI